MSSVNTIKFDLREVLGNQVSDIAGIQFSNIAYVLIFVDGINLFTIDQFEDSFLVFDELKNSTMGSGDYLLFTGVSGIADEAGWDYVEVVHEETSVKWNIERDGVTLSYVFEKSSYYKEITSIENKIDDLNSGLRMEPHNVIFPEE